MGQAGKRGSGKGQFGDYIGLAVDGEGNVYAADHLNQRIQKYDGDGKLLAIWNTPKCNFFTPRPVELAIDSQDNVYATDAKNHCIMKFDRDGNFISTIGDFSETDLPTGITVDKEGNIYITDDQYENVKKT
jgi:tripartite motif-containing protein 71